MCQLPAGSTPAPRIMPATVRLRVQLPRPAPMGKSPNTPRLGAVIQQGSFQHNGSRKDGKVPGDDKHHEQRDRLRKKRLV